MSILINPPGKKAIRVNRKRFSLEVDLQSYISENPEAIPVHEIKDDSQLLILERESPTPAGPIDILAVDNEGQLYIIETKLYKNPDKRQVLAQVLDYGAALWGFVDDPDEWIQQLDHRRVNHAQNSLIDLFEQEFAESEAVFEGIKSSLLNGTYQFLILMDEVPALLKNLILYINQNSRFSIFAVELEYYEHDGYQILIPHLFGAESHKKVSTVSKSGRRKWDETSFFEEVKQKLSQEQAASIRKVFESARNYADRITWGTGIDRGSFNPKVDFISVRSLFTIYTDGHIVVSYTWLEDDDFAFRCAELLKAKMMAFPPFRERITTGMKYPSVAIADWSPYTDDLIKLLEDYIDECRELRSEWSK